MSYISKYKGAEVDERLGLAETALQEHQDISHLASKDEVAEAVADKVVIVDGYGLSQENFTPQEKAKLQSLSNYDDTEINNKISGIEQEVQNKQDTLVSGENIKTINGQSILGEGDISINVDLDEYATKAYVDELIGDLDAVLTSIIEQ
jgi:hypothetical protein